MGIAPVTIAGAKRPEAMYAVCQGLLGSEASIALCDFVANYDSVITADDVIDRFNNVKDRVDGLTADRVSGLIEKVKNNCVESKWTMKQAKNVGAFAEAIAEVHGSEMLVSLWNAVAGSQNLPNIQKLHKLLSSRVIEAVQASRNL
jgi:hypothetical protein